jgi:hypothetical protein
LAIGSFATLRELEVLRAYGNGARYVILQYCDNDAGENGASLRLDEAEFRSQVEANWRRLAANYRQGKSQGLMKPIADLVDLISTGSYASKVAWRKSLSDSRNMAEEASLFAQILQRYRSILDGKRLILFESANWGANSRRFADAFAAEVSKLAWPRFKVLNTANMLSLEDYYFFDDHPNERGHRKLASAIAKAMDQWE